MTSHSRQIEYLEPLCQAGDRFVSGVMKMQVSYPGPLDGQSEQAVSAGCVDGEWMAFRSDLLTADLFQNLQLFLQRLK